MTGTLDSINLRRWAADCATQANNPRATGDERDRLLRMRASLLVLAETDDWQQGVTRSPQPDETAASIQGQVDQMSGIVLPAGRNGGQ